MDQAPTPSRHSASPDIDPLAARIADAATESVIVYDTQGRVRHWNHASQLLYGWVGPEVVGQRLCDVMGKGTDEGHWPDLLANGTWHGIVQRRSPEGEPVLANIRLQILYTAEDQVAKVLEYGVPADARVVDGYVPGINKDWIAVWSIDVSAALVLQAEIDRLKVTGSPLGKMAEAKLIAEQLRVHDLNATAAQIFGGDATVATMVGKSVYRFWPNKHRDALLEMTIKLLRSAENESPILKRQVGSDILAVWRGTSSLPNMVATSVTGSWSDPQKYWELEASEQRYRNLIHNVPLPLWQVDARVMSDVVEQLKATGVTDIAKYIKENPELIEFACDAVVVTELNDSAIRLFRGTDRNDFLQGVRYLFSEAPEAATRVVMTHFNGTRNHIEDMKVRALDGQLLDVLFFVTFPKAPEKLDTTLLMMVDITEQRRTEQQLRKVEADFAHAARLSALGELVTSIAHEVRQPLSVIVTDADTGMRWLDRDEPNLAKVKSLVTRIMDNAHRADQVIRRIKDMAVKSDPLRQPLDINAVAREAIVIVSAESKAHAIAIRMQLADHLPTIPGDRVQLQQVVVNLLINAIQAISARGKTLREIIIRTTFDPNGSVLLSVRDTGGGVPPEDLDRIFDSFFSTKTDGIGIGLAICRSIIADHGGTIKAENHQGLGLNIQVTLPVPAGEEPAN
ncbi:ATP-binding protein [Rhizobiaceae bacterium n13]|uniref:histidine kinase n=1 Tax=Ferirhizobium litorale TaxID=2927786 RepID=A0AAE3QG70_9HYPH|nr:ATP-binding protein [Fererhizobium litorale]MDI7865312.1 ATP-binding protein [Fererhizobium litorale]MDI7925217.1 ATP-binding protein [Fererhizobium litorale]